MYNLKAIQTALHGLVGFKPTVGSSLPTLPEELRVSRSGMYFNDLHPLITYQNILSSLDTTEYGDNPLAEYLRNVVQNGIIHTLAYAMRERKIKDVSKTIHEDVMLFDGIGNRNWIITKTGRFVGIEIDVKNNPDLVTKITKIGVQIMGQTQPFNLYVYHSSVLEPLEVIPVDNVYAGSFKWVDTNLSLKYVGDNFVPGGHYYIGYYEDDLDGNAIEVQKDLSKEPCSLCNKYDIYAYRTYSKFITVHPFSVASSALLPGDVDLWESTANNYNYNTNFGLNLQVSTVCDITDFIIRHEQIFADALMHVVGFKLMQQIANNVEHKGVSEKIRQLARYELDNKDNYTPGLQKQMDNSLKALNFDLTQVNSKCLPCTDKNRIADDVM